MSNMLTDEQLAAIRYRMLLRGDDDAIMLLAEVERLRTEYVALREIAQAVADMTDMEPLYRAALVGPVVRPKLDSVRLHQLGRQARALLADEGDGGASAPQGQ